MYGGYREARKSEDDSNSLVPSTAGAGKSRLRGLRGLVGATQPVRTVHLLEELRGMYDDIDNSASSRPANPPEDDPLISWDKHSLPKGLEWMKPTPMKSKPASANTIPETFGNSHSKNNSQLTEGLLPKDGPQISSAVGSADKPKIELDDLMKPNCPIRGTTPPIALNEYEKENVFMPLKSAVPDPHGLLSSTKKVSTELRIEVEPQFRDTDDIHKSVQREDLFTPLKRTKVAESTPLTGRFVSAHPSHKIPSIPEDASAAAKLSPPHGMHLVQSGRKSPIKMHSHLSSLTPVTHVRSSNSAFSSTKKSTVPSVGPHLENDKLSKVHNLDIWLTPAKGSSLVGNHQDLKSGISHFQNSHNPPDNGNVKSKDPEEILQLGEKQQVSKMTPLPRTVHPSAPNSCLYTPKSLVYPAPVSTAKSFPKMSSEMPPPDVPKQPVRSSPESAPPMNHSFGSIVTGKKTTNEQIFVNGKPYTVLSMLGRGGSSVVYQVLEPGTAKVLAIKCVNLSGLDQSTYDGYLNEIKLLAQLQDSDCVIRMFDHQHCKEEKLLYVVMEKGDTDLSKLIRDVSRTKKISPAMIVYYWTEMLNAVDFIHKRGTIHSDLKPANFLLVAGRLKLIDFGIASAIQADMTSVMKDCMTGTYNYISPEALCSTGTGPDGRSMKFKISYKSDVWSLGCILYNLVYGHTPFQTITHQFTKMKAIADPKHKIPFPPSPGCPTAIKQAMQACLVRDPKLRPSVEELLQYPYFGSVEPATGQES